MYTLLMYSAKAMQCNADAQSSYAQAHVNAAFFTCPANRNKGALTAVCLCFSLGLFRRPAPPRARSRRSSKQLLSIHHQTKAQGNSERLAVANRISLPLLATSNIAVLVYAQGAVRVTSYGDTLPTYILLTTTTLKRRSVITKYEDEIFPTLPCSPCSILGLPAVCILPQPLDPAVISTLILWSSSTAFSPPYRRASPKHERAPFPQGAVHK